jgi:hypothetical protein
MSFFFLFENNTRLNNLHEYKRLEYNCFSITSVLVYWCSGVLQVFTNHDIYVIEPFFSVSIPFDNSTNAPQVSNF